MPVPVEEPTVHNSVRQAISFFGGAAKHPKSQLTTVALSDQQRLPAPQATRDDDNGGGRTAVDVRSEAEQLWSGHDPRADGESRWKGGGGEGRSGPDTTHVQTVSLGGRRADLTRLRLPIRLVVSVIGQIMV
ncbi:hypothetical protein FJT64_017765 [Amphibalanus amphitrite]|uniref:Uncharacterized protein n=1 Tax=Amphibalanus amphitrite TaxID=1232801 RepID=A0A6A4WWE3_AMPAM|nr:hypothetical protein FJT64_017765 [Amphibalanus amphitrite]